MLKLRSLAPSASLRVILALLLFVQTVRTDDDFPSDILRLRRQRTEVSSQINKQPYHVKRRSTRSMRNATSSLNNKTDVVLRCENLTLTRVLPKPEHFTAPPLLTAMAFSRVFKLATVPTFHITAAALPPQSNCRYKEHSCSNKCTNNTVYSTFRFSTIKQPAVPVCYCDKACNDIFSDCCNDYKQTCSMNSKLSDTAKDDFYKRKLNWRCTAIKMSTGSCLSTSGFWTIARCPTTWPNDEVKTKCHNPAKTLNPHSLYLYLPVTGLSDLLTYRNQYCGICNNVSRYEFWRLIFKKEAIPPPYYTPEDFKKFIERNYQNLVGIRPKEAQRIRWCKYPDVIKTCPNSTSVKTAKDCVQGTAGLVEQDSKIFRNKACAQCNGYRFTCGVAKKRSDPCATDSSAITRAISLRDYGVSMTTESCRKNEVYDTFLKKCRQTYVINELNLGSVDEYHVTMSVLKETTLTRLFSFPTKSLEDSITNYFHVNRTKVKDIVHKSTGLASFDGRENTESFITFKIQLTQAQSLILASDTKLNESITLRRLFKFSEAFELPVDAGRLTIYRLKIRQLNCTRPHVYQHGQYIVLNDSRIRVLSSGAIYDQFEYYMKSTAKNATVTVCLKIVSRRCNDSFIKLNSSEFHFTNNLSLVYNSLVYNLGDYIYDNGVVFICVSFERHFTRTIRSTATKDDLALVILTWIGFLLSIIGLLALLFTYITFKELRTLPGKNLINLCLSLGLAELFWLIGSTLDSYPTTCTVVAIANHYFFLVFFTASSVIAFHSCLVFGRRKMCLRRTPSEDNKIFVGYSLIVWAIPALFLLIFGLLDHYEMFIIDYGRSVVCWLGTKQSKIFLFILPFGILVLLNLFFFGVIVFRLRENHKSSARAFEGETKNREKQNVMVCLKLSTLMGFSWLFGLLQIAVETETDVFAYLFIIFVSFQGLFICAAFLFQRKSYELYHSLILRSFNLSKGTTSAESSSNARKGRPEITDTKL